MKKLCKCIIIGGAVAGMMIGAGTAYMTAIIIKNKTSVCGVMKCKAKEAFKAMGDKFSM